MKEYKISWQEILTKIKRLKETTIKGRKTYGVPRGGAVISALLGNPVDNWEEADFIVDDIVDSGETKRRWKEKIGNKPFIPLYETSQFPERMWLIFPWEEENPLVDDKDLIIRQLERIGEDPKREGLVETPGRVVSSWETIYGGYKKDPSDVFKVFSNTENYNQIVLLKDIEFYSTCEHHLLPFFGKAHIAYIPNDKIIGVSKLARLLEIFSRRMQIQERICKQVTEELERNLHPKGTACIIEAQHFCIKSRGVNKQDSIMITSNMTGVFLEKDSCRTELMNLIRQ